MKSFFSYLVLDILTGGANPDANGTMYSLRFVPFFGFLNEVSSEELVIRTITTIGLWISIYCMLQIMHGTVAILAVATSLMKVKTWRPLFGPPSKAYTIRQFWRYFLTSAYLLAKSTYHQLLPILSGQLLIHCLPVSISSGPRPTIRNSPLHPPGSPTLSSASAKAVSSLAISFCSLVFLVSSLHHAATDMAEGMSWRTSGSIQFFMTQLMGVVVEDAAQGIWRRIGGEPNECSVRLLGYLWVLAFHVWSVPAWIYPSLVDNKGKEKDMIVPFSLVSTLRGMKR